MNDNIIFIPARSGSTRVPKKNLQKIGGETLMSKKIKTCIKAKIGKVIVSTNGSDIKKHAEKAGAIVPFLRPKIYSSSNATMISSILHFLRFLKKNKKKLPKFITLCPVTNPFLKVESIINAYNKIKKGKFNSLATVAEPTDHPFQFVNLKKKINFNIFKVNGLIWSDLERTQDWPKIYISSSALKITRTEYFLRYLSNKSPLFKKKVCDIKSTTFLKISKIESYDINNQFDLSVAKHLIKNENFYNK